MEIVALVILILFSLAGFTAIFFTTFGTLVILIGAIIYAFLTGFSVINMKVLVLLAALYFLGEVLEYILVILGVKKLGASNAAVVGALIGGILGAVLGVGFFGVGIILGTFLGIFLGAALVELIIHRDTIGSLKAGAGGVLGRVGSIAAKSIIAIGMFAVMAHKIATHLIR